MLGQVRRSLILSASGVEAAKRGLIRHSLTQNALAKELGITRQTVSKFFRGRPVDRQYFVNICDRLELDWEDLVIPLVIDDAEGVLPLPESDSETDGIVKQLRFWGYQSIQQRCGSIRVLDMSVPIPVEEIYTDIYVLKRISGRRRLTLADLDQLQVRYQKLQPDSLEIPQRLAGMEIIQQHPKLILLGKPGCGKTTFLRYLSIQCNQGRIYADKVPIFVRLKDFAECTSNYSLLEYIASQFIGDEAIILKLLEKVLKYGRAFILLDGLDEVRDEHDRRVFRQVFEFFDRFYLNQFIITCRVAAKCYTIEDFTEVEIADFDGPQVTEFVENWFRTRSLRQAEQLLSAIHAQKTLREIARTPLLLTLLCLVFEDAGKLPSSDVEIYQESLEIFLRKWDEKRNVQRGSDNQLLSMRETKELLKQIAFLTLKHNRYLIEQRELEQYIEDYIRQTPDATVNQRNLDSEAILKMIEAQYGLLVERAKGIYSFCHFGFHEFFAAQYLAGSIDSFPKSQLVEELLDRSTRSNWQRIFTLAAELHPSPDDLMLQMKRAIDQRLTQDKDLKSLIDWLNQKTSAVLVSHPSSISNTAALHAFYLELALAYFLESPQINLEMTLLLDCRFTCNLPSTLSLDVALRHLLVIDQQLARRSSLTHHYKIFHQVVERTLARAERVDAALFRSLHKLKQQVPTFDSHANVEVFLDWWMLHGNAWKEQLRKLAIQHRNIGHTWQLEAFQKESFQHYYQANLLLLRCLKKVPSVSEHVQHIIEKSVLLPTPQ